MQEIQKVWSYDSLEAIAAAFEKSEIKIISFDVFDTLVVRPVEHPSDIFELLDQDFGEYTDAQVSFRQLRTEAEAILRRKIIAGEIQREDIFLKDIYQVLHTELGISEKVTEIMRKKELEAELHFCSVRESGKYLYERAIATGKPVVLISDMYLNKEEIKAILDKNGYTQIVEIYVSSELGKRKTTGNLYRRVLKELRDGSSDLFHNGNHQESGWKPSELFHIGDNQESDCRIPSELGIRTAWLPQMLTGYEACGCAHQVKKICADLTDWEAAKTSIGIGIQRAMTAKCYFDDPFRHFEKTSDYNGDPYLVGYGALGMELLALTKWLADQLQRDRIEEMIFLSRDGYLPKLAYEQYRAYHPELPPAKYLHVSRLSLLPVMMRTPEDLFTLPVDLSYQTPRKILRLLKFCSEEKRKPFAQDFPGFSPDENFTRGTFQTFITAFIRKRYNRQKHEKAIAHISRYLLENKTAPLTEKSALFDMGYSGRIVAAIMYASKLRPAVYYFHADAREHFRLEKRLGMKIRTFFDFNPYMESSLREYSYLEPAASCIGYTEDLEPIYDIGIAEGYEDTVNAMQKGALDFLRDYLTYFHQYEELATCRVHEAAMSFEAFLRYCSVYDRKMYENVLIDDELWGGRRDINLRYLMETRLRKIPDYAKEREQGGVQ